MGSLFGGGSSTTKVKTKRDIPESSEEEKQLLEKLMSLAMQGTFHVRPNLQQTLLNPYQTAQSLPELTALLRNPYRPSMEMIKPFSFYQSPQWQQFIMKPIMNSIGRTQPRSFVGPPKVLR